jgi:glycosyltransferase involved in cell wall biosynthesis
VTKRGPGLADRASLRISYIFPQFPVITQVFAVSDIAALRAQGHEVVVHTIKVPRSNEGAWLRRTSVPSDLPIRRPSFVGALRWPSLLWKRRAQVAYLVRRIAAQARSEPAAVVTALLSIPRVLEIGQEIEAGKADVVHVFWSRHPGMVLPVLAQSGSTAVRSAFVGAYDLVADDFFVDLTLAWSDLAFSHAETNRTYLQRRAPLGMPVHIIHRGIPLMERAVNIARDPKLWLTASSLTVAKNVEGVLRTFAQARGKRPDLRLDICGEGPDRARLEQICRQIGCFEAVTFRGHVERVELFRHMQRASVFLLLSKKPSERLPNVIKEALWAGCAIVSSPSEGIEELLPADSRIGHIVDPDDHLAVAQAVHAILSEGDQDAQDRKERAGKLISERFSNDLSMRRYVAAWQDSMVHRARYAHDGTAAATDAIASHALDTTGRQALRNG